MLREGLADGVVVYVQGHGRGWRGGRIEGAGTGRDEERRRRGLAGGEGRPEMGSDEVSRRDEPQQTGFSGTAIGFERAASFACFTFAYALPLPSSTTKNSLARLSPNTKQAEAATESRGAKLEAVERKKEESSPSLSPYSSPLLPPASPAPDLCSALLLLPTTPADRALGTTSPTSEKEETAVTRKLFAVCFYNRSYPQAGGLGLKVAGHGLVTSVFITSSDGRELRFRAELNRAKP